MSHPDQHNGGGTVPTTNPNDPRSAAVRAQKPGNLPGLISVIGAILGLILSVISKVALIGWILIPISFVLGVVALFQKNRSRTLALAGIGLSVLAAVVAIIAAVWFSVGKIADTLNNDTTVVPVTSGAVATETANHGHDHEHEHGHDHAHEATGAAGTVRENPLPLGTTFDSHDWAYSINSVDFDATDAVLAHNPNNEVPAEGSKYILVNVTATYKGDSVDGEMPAGHFHYVTAEGYEIDNTAFELVPDALDEFALLQPEASTTGNLAFRVPVVDTEQGVISIQPTPTAEEIYFSLQ